MGAAALWPPSGVSRPYHLRLMPCGPPGPGPLCPVPYSTADGPPMLLALPRRRLQGCTLGSRAPTGVRLPSLLSSQSPLPHLLLPAWLGASEPVQNNGTDVKCVVAGVRVTVPASPAAEGGKEPEMRDSPAAPRQSPAALPSNYWLGRKRWGPWERGFSPAERWVTPRWASVEPAGLGVLAVAPQCDPWRAGWQRWPDTASAGRDPRPGRAAAQRGPGCAGGSGLAAAQSML